jgi:Fis family transcriptional regulator
MKTKRIDMKEAQEALKVALTDYLDSLESPEEACNVNSQVIDGFETVMLEIMMRYTHNNQSKAAQCMGINRATLRVKLKRHNLL